MARHEITIPVNKSSNSGHLIPVPPTQASWFTPSMVTNTLYLSNTVQGADKRVIPNNLGVAWDTSQVPVNKIIVSTKVFVYSKYSFPRGLIFKKSQFNEGMSIPQLDSSDGLLSGLLSGWNIINYNGDLEGSIIVGIASAVSYSDSDWAELYSHRNSYNKPYVIVTYDDIPPDKPSSLYPSAMTINPRDIIRFSWLHNSKEGLQQKAFALQYSTNGGSTWTTVSETTPNQYYDMPANILPSTGTVTWRVMTTDGNDEVSGYSASSFTLGLVPQKSPIPIAPISQYMDQTKIIKFEWIFIGGSSGETQTKYDLQYSTNGGTSWTTVTNSNANQFYELLANTLASGNITWRIRTYNNYNEVSPYSENRSFTVIGSPPIPQIASITNSSRPTLNWVSSGQHIYELQILKDNKIVLDTGSIPSTSDRSYKLEDYLQDGNYIARLRITNEYNLDSPWAEKSFTISTVKPSKPIIEIYSGEYRVTIKTSNTSLKTYVYRDNEFIGEVINNNFVDYLGENKREYKYFVRTIDENDNFADSDIKLARCRFYDNTIALLSDPREFIRLSYGLGGIPKKSNSFSVIGSLVYFDGRKSPVAEFSEFEDEGKTLGFFIKTQYEVDAFKELISKRQVLIYRDSKGKNIIGTVLSIQVDDDILGYNIGFTITRCSV